MRTFVHLLLNLGVCTYLYAYFLIWEYMFMHISLLTFEFGSTYICIFVYLLSNLGVHMYSWIWLFMCDMCLYMCFYKNVSPIPDRKTQKWCSVRLYLQLSYLRYLCIVMSNTYCVLFLFCISPSCVPYVFSFSGLSIFDCPFGIL